MSRQKKTTSTRQTKIAYVVDTFGYGGLERCIARLVSGLDPERFRSVVVCLTNSGRAVDWIDGQIPVHVLNKGPGNDWPVVRRLANVLRSEQIDIVHSHNWGTLVETVLGRRLAGTPVHVHAQRGMFFHGRSASGLRQAARRMATRWACSRTDRVIAVSDSVREGMHQSWGVPLESIQVIPNGIDVPPHDASGQQAANLRQGLGIPAEAVVIGSVGRLAPVKDFGNLVRAVRRLPATEQPVHAVIVGDGRERAALRETIEQEGLLDRVHLVGEQSNVGDWLSLMDIYVNCSLSEGMSQSVLEAMAMSLPLVVTDVGANAELAGSEPACGLIVPPGQSRPLTEALLQLMTPTARQRFGRQASDRYQNRYTLPTMIHAYEDLYEQLSSQRPSGRRVADRRPICAATEAVS